MWDGFIPHSRASLVFDLLILSLLVINPLLYYSIALALKKFVSRHKKIQWVISILIVSILVLFEIDVRFFGWKERAMPSPYYGLTLFAFLAVHVCLATTLSLLWFRTLWLAAHKRRHQHLGKVTAVLMFLSTITGFAFYYMAFMA